MKKRLTKKEIEEIEKLEGEVEILRESRMER